VDRATPQTLTLSSADGGTEAQVVPEANMLCCSLRHHGTELLDQGGGVQAYLERGKTMGIPLLYPWANRLDGWHYNVAGKEVTLPVGDPRILRDPGGLPIHGVLPGLLRWDADQSETGDGAGARLAWTSPELLELFPFAHELRLDVRVRAGELAIATTVIATGDDTVPVSFGYHPYLRLPDLPRASWRVELGAFSRLLLDARMIPSGEREAVRARAFELGARSLDDAFAELDDPARFRAGADHASLTVEFHRGYRYAQVYAPPDKDFICFEPMTAPANALRSGDGLSLVRPGQEYLAEFSVAALLP
jgi:aldose 1-epimerase